jgi:hypothetical protein
MDKRDLDRIVQYIAGAIDSSLQREEPFYHLQLSNVFPADLYAEMLEAMPVKGNYRVMSGRTKSTRTKNGGGTRTKIDLFPEYIRHFACAEEENLGGCRPGAVLKASAPRVAWNRAYSATSA